MNESPMLDGPTVASAGERRLLVAVLVHALRSVFRDAERPGRGAIRRLRQDVRWLTSADRTEVFAFERICESLAIDEAKLRQYVLGELAPVLQLLEAQPRRRRSRPSLQPQVVFTEPVRAAG